MARVGAPSCWDSSFPFVSSSLQELTELRVQTDLQNKENMEGKQGESLLGWGLLFKEKYEACMEGSAPAQCMQELQCKCAA